MKIRRRAVAPIIATLLLVAIAVVGGSIIFMFTQEHFATAQPYGIPHIESLKVTGYDATEGTTLIIHDDTTPTTLKGATGNGLVRGERIAVYVQNNSVGKVTLDEIRFGGTVYSFVPNSATMLDTWTVSTNDGILGTPGIPSFVILTKGPDTILNSSVGELQPGQQATVILELAENIKINRDVQFKMTTRNNAVTVGTVLAGQSTTTAIGQVTPMSDNDSDDSGDDHDDDNEVDHNDDCYDDDSHEDEHDDDSHEDEHDDDNGDDHNDDCSDDDSHGDDYDD